MRTTESRAKAQRNKEAAPDFPESTKRGTAQFSGDQSSATTATYLAHIQPQQVIDTLTAREWNV